MISSTKKLFLIKKIGTPLAFIRAKAGQRHYLTTMEVYHVICGSFYTRSVDYRFGRPVCLLSAVPRGNKTVDFSCLRLGGTFIRSRQMVVGGDPSCW
jgi:hypothetical protein